MNLCTARNISVFRSYENDLFPCNNKSILMSILLFSFIPFTIRLWNTLPLTITESPSLNIFKNRLTHFYKTWDTGNAHYNFGIRKFNIIHCQLRNEASNLKAHLFNDFCI
jgi:hypothetical protein